MTVVDTVLLFLVDVCIRSYVIYGLAVVPYMMYKNEIHALFTKKQHIPQVVWPKEPPKFADFVDFLRPVDVFILSRVSKQVYVDLSIHRKTAIDHLLEYIPQRMTRLDMIANPDNMSTKRMKKMIGFHDCILQGSVVLEYMLGEKWHDVDLQIIFFRDRDMVEVLDEIKRDGPPLEATSDQILRGDECKPATNIHSALRTYAVIWSEEKCTKHENRIKQMRLPATQRTNTEPMRSRVYFSASLVLLHGDDEQKAQLMVTSLIDISQKRNYQKPHLCHRAHHILQLDNARTLLETQGFQKCRDWEMYFDLMGDFPLSLIIRECCTSTNFVYIVIFRFLVVIVEMLISCAQQNV
jgi:hypothetical protein